MRRSSSGRSSASIARTSTPARASGWRPSSASFADTPGRSGPRERWDSAPSSTSRWETAVGDHRILLIEDNADDEALTLRALKEHGIANAIDVARDGAQALDYLFGDDGHPRPELILLDLKLPRIDGLEVLSWIRSTERTKLVPVVILT